MPISGAIVFLPRDEGETSLFLRPILFDPAAAWLSAALERTGVERFLVVCHDDDRVSAEACFPDGTEFLTAGSDDAAQVLTEFLAQCGGGVAVFTAPVFLDDQGARRLNDGELPRGDDCGVYAIDAKALTDAMEHGADFLTAVRTAGTAFGVCPGLYEGLLPLSRMEVVWDSAQQIAKHASVDRLTAGLSSLPIRILDKEAVYIGPRVTVGGGTILLPGTILRGNTAIGRRCEIGPNAMLTDCAVGHGVTVNASQLVGSSVGDDTSIGPYAYLRPGCRVGSHVRVGTFVELKNTTVGDNVKVAHLSYLGDSDVGDRVDIGGGTITVNYDGAHKFRTIVEDDAFVGCGVNLVAPVTVGGSAHVATGSTITESVPADGLAVARSSQVNKRQWALKQRARRD